MSRPRRPRPKLEQAPQFPVLDTLRAVGAVAVLTTHVAFQTGDYGRHGIVGALLARLDIGVAVFFVLSGFLLSRPYLASAAASRKRPATGEYYRKRFLRIYPVYAVSVVLALTVIPENHDAGLLEWLRTLTLTNVFTTGRLPQGLTQMWSLSVEATFYLVLPLLMRAALGRPRVFRPRRILLLIASGVAVSCWWNGFLVTEIDTVTFGAPRSFLPAHLTWFLVGIALALLHVLHQTRPHLRPVRLLVALGSMPGVCWAAAGGLMLVAATPLGGPTLLIVATSSQSVVKHLLYAVIAGLVTLTGIFAVTTGRYARLMSATWLRHLGHISYSTFSIHLVVLHLVRTFTGHVLFSGQGLQIWTLTLVVSLAVSEILYRFVERPGMRLNSRGPRRNHPTGRAKSAARTTTTRY